MLEQQNSTRDIFYHLISRVRDQSKLVVVGTCFFEGIIFTARNNIQNVSVTFNVYDSAVAVTDIYLVPYDMKKVWWAGEDNYFAVSYDPPVRAESGIYVELVAVSGPGIFYQVVYDQGL